MEAKIPGFGHSLGLAFLSTKNLLRGDTKMKTDKGGKLVTTEPQEVIAGSAG